MPSLLKLLLSGMCVFTSDVINNWWHGINPILLIKQVLHLLYGSYAMSTFSF